MRKGIWDRFADLLWRDRDSYDPITGTVGEDDNVSLLTKFRKARRRFRLGIKREWKWCINTLLALMALTISAAAYLHTEAHQQVNAAHGELLLRCAQDGHGVYRCHAVGAQDEVITGSHGQGLDRDGATQP